MNPEEQHEIYKRESTSRSIKKATRMARARFTLVAQTEAYEFKVYMQLWDDKDFDYNYFNNHCKKLATDGLELNNSSYQVMSDILYEALANTVAFGSDVTIVINTGDIGLTTHYKN